MCHENDKLLMKKKINHLIYATQNIVHFINDFVVIHDFFYSFVIGDFYKSAYVISYVSGSFLMYSYRSVESSPSKNALAVFYKPV